MTTRSIGLISLTSWLLVSYFALTAAYLDRDVYGDQYHSLVIVFGVLAGALAVPGLIYGVALYSLKAREFNERLKQEPPVVHDEGTDEGSSRA